MKLFNRVRFATPTVGTGDIAVGAAVRSSVEGDYLTPAEAGAANSDPFPYFIIDAGSFAYGLGTYSTTGPTLVRDAAEVSWNGTTLAAGKLNLSGNAQVMVSPRAADLLLADQLDTDGTLAANSDALIASQKAVRTFVSAMVANVLELAGTITNANTNPNYPAAAKGDSYIIATNAGRVGGASGKQVEIGDLLVAIADNAGGTEASVGGSWIVLEHNLQGALLSANNLSDVANAATARTNLGLGSIATLAAPSGSVVGTSDAQILTNKELTAPVITDPKTRHTLNPQTGTTYTLVLADEGKMVTLSNAGAITLTVPPNSSVAFPVGANVDIAQLGAGQVTIAPGAGVTLRSTPGLKLRAQYSGAVLRKIATDEWLIIGDLAA